MGSPRHSPCLGYLLAIIFTLSISLQCVNSLNGVFNVQTKLLSKPFLMLKSHQRHKHHDRMLFGPSPIDLNTLGGNSTLRVYTMEIGVGTPPQMHKVLVDTGSSEIWLNCKGCQNCVTDNIALGLHIPPFDPTLSLTSKTLNYTKEGCEIYPEGRCGFDYSYGEGDRAMSGYVMEDEFVIGNPLTGAAVTANLRFGCTTKQVYNANSDGNDFLEMGIDGVIGFGDEKDSITNQLGSSGVTTKELSHCMDNINGGGIFAIGHVVQPNVIMNVRNNTDYTLDLLGMDFGAVNVKLNATRHAPYALFDSGSDRLYVPESEFETITTEFDKLMASKNAIVRRRVDDTACFKLPGKELSREVVDQEFPSMSFHFNQSQVLTVSPHNYIRTTTDEGFEGYWCLYMWKYLSRWNHRDVFILGSSVMSEKLVVYDNLTNKLGFVDYDCSAPIQLEGANGKPVSVGPHSGNGIIDKIL